MILICTLYTLYRAYGNKLQDRLQEAFDRIGLFVAEAKMHILYLYIDIWILDITL